MHCLICTILLRRFDLVSLFILQFTQFLSDDNLCSHDQCLSNPDGVVYMAAKKHYFGVGGGSRRFLSIVEKDGELFLLVTLC